MATKKHNNLCLIDNTGYVCYAICMGNSEKIILDLCGGTGAWSLPYLVNEYDVRLVTLPEHNVLIYEPPIPVYGILAAPPCDHFSGSGAQYWKQKDADGRTVEGLAIVDACLRIIVATRPKFWCLENPVGRLYRWIGKPRMYFQPWEYGDPYSKKTCLWGNFNAPAKDPVDPVFIVDSVRGRKYSPVHWSTGGKSKRTKELRSITPLGFAWAFFEANQ